MTRPAFILSTPAHDAYFENSAWQSWFRFHCPVVAGYTPSFDHVTQWHPCALAYWDVFAIYDSALVSVDKMAAGQFSMRTGTSDEQFILRDGSGNRLKIAWPEADGTYHQFAADITNPEFVRQALGRMAQVLEHQAANTTEQVKYAGLYLDDVNMVTKLVTEAGAPVAFDGDWRSAMLALVRAIRKEFPDKTLVHNTPWWDIDDEQIGLADYLNIERGFGDPNLKLVDGMRMARVIDQIPGKVIIEEYTKASLPISLPCYDEACQPGDLLAVEDMMPDAWGI